MAQKIASERDQVFDIEAFLTPSMREEWLAITSGRSFPAVEDRKEVAEKVNVKEEVEQDDGSAGPSTTVPDNSQPGGEGSEPAPAIQPTSLNGDGPIDTTAQSSTDEPATTATTSTLTDPTTSTASTTEAASGPVAPPVKQPFKLHANHPIFLNMHWKQRQKRLHQLAMREAAIERGEKPDYFPELEAMIRVEEEKEKEKEREEQAGQKRKRGLTEGDVQSIRASASHWYVNLSWSVWADCKVWAERSELELML